MQFLLEYSQTEFYISLFLLMLVASFVSSWLWDLMEAMKKPNKDEDEFEFKETVLKSRTTIEDLEEELSRYRSEMNIYRDNLSNALERIYNLEHAGKEATKEVILKIQTDHINDILKEIDFNSPKVNKKDLDRLKKVKKQLKEF